MRNVSRAWAYETGLAAGVELQSEIPVNEYYEYFGPDYKLDVRASNMENLNTPAYLNRVKSIVMENLKQLGGPPSVQMSDIPRLPIDDLMDDPNQDEDTVDRDERRPIWLRDSTIQKDGELSDSEDEGEGERRDHASHRDADTVTPNVGRQVRVGIMAGAGHSTGTGGASTHTSIAPVGVADDENAMDVDAAAKPSNGDNSKVNGHVKGPSPPAPPSASASVGN